MTIACEFIGIYPALTTKFSANDEIDFSACLSNVQAQIDSGVHGLILGGTLGEGGTLSSAEKSVLLEKTLAHVGEQVPIVLNLAEQTTQGAVSAAKAAKQAGASGLMLLPPMRYFSNEAETLNYFNAVADATDLPIMLYNNPVDYKAENISIAMFEKLTKLPTITAVKDSTRQISTVTEMKINFGDRYKVLCGLDTLGCESIMMGADGWVAGLGCAFPNETMAIYQLVKQGRFDEALSIHRWFYPLLVLDTTPRLVQNIKLAEAAVGLGTEYVREPRLPLSREQRSEVQSIIDRALATRPTLPAF